MSITVNILNYGAIAGSDVLQTGAIQSAIDACKAAGGGVVEVPEGTFRIASIQLYSHITLHLLAGASLVASDNYLDYSDFHVPTTLGYVHDPVLSVQWGLSPRHAHAPITAILAEDIAIIGEAGSEVNGSNCYDPEGEEHFRGPMGIVLCQCKNINLKGYTFVDSANWSHQMDSCENVHVENVTMLAGHDGINIHHCKNITIDNCTFRTGDDCIAGYDAVNLVVRNCEFNTSCSSFRLGCMNMLVEGCRFWGPGVYPHRISGRHNTLFAFLYYSIAQDTVSYDGGNWLIRNCTFENLDSLIQYDYGMELQENRPLLDVRMEEVTIKGLSQPSVFCAHGTRNASFLLRDAVVGFRKEIPDPFLTVDDAVTLVLERVTFEQKATIETGENTTVVLNGITNGSGTASKDMLRKHSGRRQLQTAESL